jgi:hypothetical protein
MTSDVVIPIRRDGDTKQPTVPPPTDDTRPVIVREDGQLPEIIAEIDAALPRMIAAGTDLFNQGGRLVSVFTEPPSPKSHTASAIHRPDGGVGVKPIDATWLLLTLSILFRFIRWDGRRAAWRAIDCPRSISESYLARGHWSAPRLQGVIEAPTLAPDGSLVDLVIPGYHAHSGFYVAAAAPSDYVQPADHPSRADATAAVEVLFEAVSTFPFVDKSDHTAAVAGIIHGVIRRSLPSAPAIGITATTAGSGKSQLQDVIAIIVTGRRAAVIAIGDDATETAKRMDGALLAGYAIIAADNVERPVRDERFCQITTQPVVHTRPLGGSAVVNVPTNATIIINGNSLDIRGDLTRRVMLIRLDPRVEQPDRLVYARDPLDYVHEHRGRLISAALTVVRAYLAAGCPVIKDARGHDTAPYGSFTMWNNWVRRPLLWLGMPDPLAPAQSLRGEDPDLVATRVLLSALNERFSGNALKASAILDDQAVTLRDALKQALGDHINSRSLGYWLRRHQGRIVDGLRLDTAGQDSHTKVALWRITTCG